MSRKKRRLPTKGRKARGTPSRGARLAGALRPVTPDVDRQLNLGAQHLACGDVAAAENCFKTALDAAPQNAIALNCMGIVNRLLGRLEPALDYLRRALDARPEFAEAHNNLGNTYRDLRRYEAAEDCFHRAIELRPTFAEAHNNLGVVLLSRDNPQQAAERFRTALQLNPDYAEAYNNLGNALRDLGDLAGAGDQYTEALRRQPMSAETHNNLANVFRDLGDPVAARAHYEQALSIAPGLAEAQKNLGTVMVDLGEYDNAIGAYREAAALEPDSVDTLINLGNAYKQQGWHAEARRAYQRAAELEPGNRLHRLRITALCPTVFASHAELESYRQTASESWEDARLNRLAGADELLTTRLIEPAFGLQFLDGNLRELKEEYASIFAARFPRRQLARRLGKPRIGIVVTTTHEGIFVKSLRGVLERLPAEMADLVVVCPQSSGGFIRDNIDRELSVVSLPRSLKQIEHQLHAAAFDVLYYWEIGSDATNYFLPFLRLAPVQCTSWGVQVTSGIPNVDYYLSSGLIEADDAQAHYSEQLLLASTLLTYQYRPPVPANYLPRQTFGLRDDQHVYLCAQQLGKFHPDFDDTLAAILRRDPQGVLAVTEDQQASARQILETRWRQQIPDVADRIVFVPRQERLGYVSLIQTADVLLDPPHFGGVNTSYDAFSLGKAIVTLPSPYHRGRYTLGCYRKMGIDNCVAENTEQYVELALALGTEPLLRRQTEQVLREASQALFEDTHAVREHARLFAELIELARSGHQR